MPDRKDAEHLDSIDPLAAYRSEFRIADPDLIYVDGNSLGRLPERTIEAVSRTVAEDWGEGLVRSWHGWIDLPASVGDKIAPLIGASPGEVIVGDSTSVNLYKLAKAALARSPARRTIVCDTGDFPTDIYIMEGIARDSGCRLARIDPDPVHGVAAADIEMACAEYAEDVALVVLSHVNYRSGAVADMHAITHAAHAGGAMMLWDLSHSAGSIEIDLGSSGAELAVGCTYKYLNGGPGAPAYMFVRRETQDSLTQPIWGWFSQQDQFGFAGTYQPATGIRKFLVGTPPILSLVAASEGIVLVSEAGVPALRAKNIALTEMMIAFFDEQMHELGLSLASPRDADKRGSHVSLSHPDAYRICTTLIDRYRVVPDFRAPDVIRLGVPAIYTRFVDAFDAMDRLAALLRAGDHVGSPGERARVT
ncbi:MAG: kynureninase [Actinomycetota bacterium]|nr:kynureninase [Actinomycetota bacterium]